MSSDTKEKVKPKQVASRRRTAKVSSRAAAPWERAHSLSNLMFGCVKVAL